MLESLSRTSQSSETQELQNENESQLKNKDIIFRQSPEFDKIVTSSRYDTGEVKVTYVELLNINDEPIFFVEFNQKVKIRFFFEALAKKQIAVNVSVFDDKKNNITGCGFRHVDQPYLTTRPGEKLMSSNYLCRRAPTR